MTAKPRTSETADKMLLRLPPGLKPWIIEQARRNGGSQNTEVVRRLQDAKDRETTNAK